jgi:hypothetical protein
MGKRIATWMGVSVLFFVVLLSMSALRFSRIQIPGDLWLFLRVVGVSTKRL